MFHFISLNIEGNKHYPQWVSFVKKQAADVVCLQEVLEPDLPELSEQLGFKYYIFTPMARMLHGHPQGQAILTHVKPTSSQVIPYAGGGTGTTPIERYVAEYENMDAYMASTKFTLLVADIPHQEQTVRVITTHYPWTPNGSQPCSAQRGALPRLLTSLGELKKQGDFVLCGDFNMPRGYELFDELTRHYTDNIPPHYTCSLDLERHRAPTDVATYMVDGLFTTPGYEANNVTLHSGVSDHMGITAQIRRRA